MVAEQSDAHILELFADAVLWVHCSAFRIRDWSGGEWIGVDRILSDWGGESCWANGAE